MKKKSSTASKFTIDRKINPKFVNFTKTYVKYCQSNKSQNSPQAFTLIHNKCYKL